MNFCPACRNMMLVKTSPDGKTAEFRCPNCDTTKEIGSGQVLREKKPSDDYAMYAKYLTPSLSKDPALPRSPVLKCPFCEKVGDVLYVKYNSKAMLYLYHCGSCKEFWKRGGHQVKKAEPEAEAEKA